MNCRAVKSIIVNWLKEELHKSNQTGFILGVSGGVDSALVSILCAETNHSTWVFSMPIHQADDQLERATKHILYLKAHYPKIISRDIDLTNFFESFKETIPDNINDLALANTRSRLRMVTLFAYASHNKLLVAGTGNQIEDRAVMYFTKYGDGAVDLSPIGNLSKSQVIELAEFLGVNKEITQAKPTDGLWADNRGDEDVIGATYKELEWAMAYCDIHNLKLSRPLSSFESFPLPDQGLSEREKEVLIIYLQKNAQGMHKINPIPICEIPKVLL